MRALTASALAVTVALATGCATERSRTAPPRPVSVREQPTDPLLRSDVDELLRFAAGLADADATHRKAVCRDLLQRARENPQPALQLHLLVGRTVTKSCGEIGSILQAVSTIRAGPIKDPRLQWLIAKDTATLQEMQRLGRSASARGSRTQKSRAADCPPALQSDEARRLKQKLEEIRAIEQQMDRAEPAE